MATYTSSYDLSSVTHSQYGVNGGTWGSATTQGTNDGDNNAYYIGRGYWSGTGTAANWRPRLYFTIPSTLKIAGTAKLTIAVSSGQAWTPGYMRAFLSTKNTTNSDFDYIVGAKSTEADRLAMSYLYSDSAGTAQQTAYMALSNNKTKTCYIIFEYKFVPGTTYYVYLLPYDSNSHAIDNVTFTNTWGQPRNLNSSWTQVTLEYNSGVVKIYTSSGWKDAIPYVYSGEWKQCIPYCYSGGWKIASG